MSSASVKKIIPCKKNQLIEMVLDIEKYPEFIPWCIEGKILNKKELSDTFKTRHIHENINFEQFLCILAALGEDPTFKAQVAFQQLSPDGGKTIN